MNFCSNVIPPKYAPLILNLLLLLYCNNLQAQQDSIQNNSFYFNDGGISETKHIIKLNILSVIDGNISFYYERKLNKSWSIETGIGVLLPYYAPKLTDLLSDEDKRTDHEVGYNVWIHPKNYIQGKAPELTYIGLQLKNTNYKQDNETIAYTDIILDSGMQHIIRKKIILGYNIGVGYRLTKEKLSSPNHYINKLITPIGISLGIIL